MKCPTFALLKSMARFSQALTKTNTDAANPTYFRSQAFQSQFVQPLVEAIRTAGSLDLVADQEGARYVLRLHPATGIMFTFLDPFGIAQALRNGNIRKICFHDVEGLPEIVNVTLQNLIEGKALEANPGVEYFLRHNTTPITLPPGGALPWWSNRSWDKYLLASTPEKAQEIADAFTARVVPFYPSDQLDATFLRQLFNCARRFATECSAPEAGFCLLMAAAKMPATNARTARICRVIDELAPLDLHGTIEILKLLYAQQQLSMKEVLGYVADYVNVHPDRARNIPHAVALNKAILQDFELTEEDRDWACHRTLDLANYLSGLRPEEVAARDLEAAHTLCALVIDCKQSPMLIKRIGRLSENLYPIDPGKAIKLLFLLQSLDIITIDFIVDTSLSYLRRIESQETFGEQVQKTFSGLIDPAVAEDADARLSIFASLLRALHSEDMSALKLAALNHINPKESEYSLALIAYALLASKRPDRYTSCCQLVEASQFKTEPVVIDFYLTALIRLNSVQEALQLSTAALDKLQGCSQIRMRHLYLTIAGSRIFCLHKMASNIADPEKKTAILERVLTETEELKRIAREYQLSASITSGVLIRECYCLEMLGRKAEALAKARELSEMFPHSAAVNYFLETVEA